jgi:hypothetical protein
VDKRCCKEEAMPTQRSLNKALTTMDR